MSSFNNYNSQIGNQVIGTLNIDTASRSELGDFVGWQLERITERLRTDNVASKHDINEAMHRLDEIKSQLTSHHPKSDIIERSLSMIGSVASVASLIDQIKPFLSRLL